MSLTLILLSSLNQRAYLASSTVCFSTPHHEQYLRLAYRGQTLQWIHKQTKGPMKRHSKIKQRVYFVLVSVRYMGDALF